MDKLLALKPDEDNSTPLYLQLSQKLATAINAGVWHANEALPSERAFCDALGVSRVTARKAMDLLFEQGLIMRRQGSGTYITPKLEQPLSRLSSFSEELSLRGFHPSSQWISRDVGFARQEEVLKLGLSPNTQVARLQRLRKADGVVMAIETTTLPARYLPHPERVGDSLYQWLDSAGTPIVRALQHIRAVNATEEQAALAGIAPGTAMLHITRVGYLQNNLAIELTHTYCRNDYYDFVAELRR
ncbi:GntR family transcriptional regulator [Leeia oryzae]|uniref:GntR family transcriptional regulator n=1 Tax=Leeia oryzae TaxID=356662 RepID=UPI00037980EF|nr:GntR family transcriptional regulator [Leeia oryzae]